MTSKLVLKPLIHSYKRLKYVFNVNELGRRSLFSSSGYRDNPEPASAEGGSSPDVWMGRRVGNKDLISLIFKYDYQQDALILNLVSEIVDGH